MRDGRGVWPRRRRLVASCLNWSLLVVLFVGATVVLDTAGGGPTQATARSRSGAPDGELLWRRDCVSCHGPTGAGTAAGPSIDGVGTLGIDFVLRTGRMPLEDLDRYEGDHVDPSQFAAEPGPPAYTPDEIDALVAHVSGFIDGPDVPDLDLAGADLSRGRELFQANCAACHAWSGRGGALTDGTIVPGLVGSTPIETVGAMRLGVGTMPRFTDAAFDEEEATDVAAYVEYLQDPADIGGNPLAYLGPVAEGAVAWLVGIVGLLVVVRWVGTRVGDR